MGPLPATAVKNKAFEDQDPALCEETNFDALMRVITTCQTTFTGTIESMQLDISLIWRDMDCFRTRLTEAGRRMGDTEDTLKQHTAPLHTLQTKIKTLEARAEDAERRKWGNNLYY